MTPVISRLLFVQYKRFEGADHVDQNVRPDRDLTQSGVATSIEPMEVMSSHSLDERKP
jgi:hypothetical protein